MDHLFMRVVQLGQAAQKHCRGSDVLIASSELWGTVPPIHGVVLDPTSVTPGVARWFMRAGHSVVCRARWRSHRLVQSLLS